MYDDGAYFVKETLVKKVLIVVDHIYEDLELWYPKIRLEEEGHQVVVAGPKRGEVYKGKHGYPCKADLSFDQIQAGDFAGIVIPGGFAPDKLRQNPHVLEVTHALNETKKVVAFICHGGWVPISAKILKGRRATSYVGIKDDMENAGAIWSDEPCVVDNNLISSRKPVDLPQFAKALISKM